MGLFDDFNLWQARRVYTDNYICYAEVVGAKQLRQGKKNTYKIDIIVLDKTLKRTLPININLIFLEN